MRLSNPRVLPTRARRQAGLTLLRLMLLLATIGIVLTLAARLLLKH
jgi:type II secretory pathway pseudopilin PulG